MKQVLYFSKTDCAPCNALKPLISELQSEMTIMLIDADTSAETCRTWNVKSVPTLLFIQNGMETGRLIGNSIQRNKAIEFYNK